MSWIFDQIHTLYLIFFYLIQVVHWTLLITVCAFALSLAIGLLLAFGRVSSSAFIRFLAATYINVLRGVPLLVLIFFVYFGLGALVNLDRFLAGVLAVGACYGAYTAEIFRSGISAIEHGQYEAAQSLGMTRWQTMRYIILPQALRIAVPPIGNEFIACLKDSSLVSIIGLRELTRAGRDYAAQSFLDFQTWLTVGAVYLMLTLLFTRLVRYVERRLAIPGFGVRRHVD